MPSRIPSFLLSILTVSILWAGQPSFAVDRQMPASAMQMKLSFAPLVKKVAPAVVNIYSHKVVKNRQGLGYSSRKKPSGSRLFDDPFFQRFFGRRFGFDEPEQRVQNSLGSGVIIEPNGYIVTNHHVIAGADQIKVVLADRREFAATLIGSDERTDLAVLKIKAGAEKLPVLQLGNSDKLEVGDLVLAIGNPYGVGQTVTNGIVSAVARTKLGESGPTYFIQTDAAINPGNSGGALVALDGRLIGINTAIFSQSGGSHGIGFAIPANMVRAVVVGLKKGGRLVRPWFGAWGQSISSDIAASLGLARPQGIIVTNVYKTSPADQAGVKVGDVIISINNRAVNDPQALDYRIATLVLGQKSSVTIMRKGKRKPLSFNVQQPPEVPRQNLTELKGPHPLSGAVVANMSPALADELDLAAFHRGVIVMKLRRGGSAIQFFQPGDMILKINNRKAATVSTLKKIMTDSVSEWRIQLMRNQKTMNVVIGR
jgi:Do/DeqQ family serine protease